MDKKQVRQLIEKQIKKTTQKVKDYEEMSSPISPDDAIGRISRMDAINNKSVAEAALRQAKEKLSKLRHALIKLDEAKFGNCKKCSNPIPIMRVVLMPESPYCVHCAD